MPRIINAGLEQPAGQKPWYVGRLMSCFGCSCRWEIEEADNVATTAERRPGGKQTAAMPCPNCGRVITLTNVGGDGGLDPQGGIGGGYNGYRDTFAGPGWPYAQ